MLLYAYKTNEKIKDKSESSLEISHINSKFTVYSVCIMAPAKIKMILYSLCQTYFQGQTCVSVFDALCTSFLQCALGGC